MEGGYGGDGGGVYSYHGTLTVMNSMLAANSANDDGGGIYSYYGTLTVTNSTLVANSADDNGGGIHSGYGTLTVTNSTLSGNAADDGGGGIYTHADHALTLANSILWQNRGGDLDASEPANAIAHSLIGIDPQFVRDPSDGGDGWGDDPSTADIDESANDDLGDLRLTSRSPAVDYGDDALAVDAQGNPLATDLDGNLRIHGTSVDCGALEFQGDVAPGRETPSLTVNTAEDVLTFTTAGSPFAKRSIMPKPIHRPPRLRSTAHWTAQRSRFAERRSGLTSPLPSTLRR